MAGKKTKSTLRRFWSFIDRRGPDECWLWKGAHNNHTGHGHFTLRPKPNRKLIMAYRLMWMLAYGPIPAGMNVCHRCDNPACVNPSHLFLGTQAANLADMRAKRRHAHGETNGHAKLTTEQVLEIKRLALAGVKQKEIAARFGVDPSHVSYIKSGKHWAHLHGSAA